MTTEDMITERERLIEELRIYENIVDSIRTSINMLEDHLAYVNNNCPSRGEILN